MGSGKFILTLLVSALCVYTCSFKFYLRLFLCFTIMRTIMTSEIRHAIGPVAFGEDLVCQLFVSCWCIDLGQSTASIMVMFVVSYSGVRYVPYE